LIEVEKLKKILQTNLLDIEFAIDNKNKLYILQVRNLVLNKKNNISNWVLVSLSLIIITIILWNTFLFFQKFKTEERAKMEIWSLAQIELTKSLEDDNISNLTLEVLRNNSTTPMIKVNKNGEIEFNNIKVQSFDVGATAAKLFYVEKVGTLDIIKIELRYKGSFTAQPHFFAVFTSKFKAMLK
jgi:hypothetical protein